MNKRFIAVLLVGVLALSVSACKSSDTFFEKIESIAKNTSGDEDGSDSKETNGEETKSGLTLPDGTLKDSRLTEQEKPFVGFWEAEDGHLLAIREAAVKEDMYENKERTVIKDTDVNETTTGEFPLDAIILFPYVNEKMDRDNTWWDIITRGNGSLYIQEQDDKLILQDSQQCPADAQYSSTHETTEELTYDSATDTITYRMLVEGEAASWDGADGSYINQVVFQRTDRDIEEANWDDYYTSDGWLIGRDPR